ncbi:MAG: isoprenylcysteine carboxylmethyltransferase family protein [Armatimonadota bacterium]|nr:isoprenylcysteine carboxylmethyltransferase family protein [Armatimonadota bacterium]
MSTNTTAPGKSKPRQPLIVRRRIKIGQALILPSLFIVLFVRHPWPEGSYIDFALDTIGYALLLAGVLGRLWCTLYIGGRKQSTLQQTGPYSMVRHPLYVCNLLIALGICVLSQNLILLALVLAYFVWQYRTTIRFEEAELARIFEEEHAQYTKSVPCFIPKVSALRFDPPETVNLKPLKSEVVRAGVFLSLVPLFHLLSLLQENGVLPSLIRLP